MIRYLTLEEVLDLYNGVMQQSGGSAGIRSLGGVQSALAQPLMTFGGNDLYPTLVEKASALGYSLVMNHPFVDGNKRIGHAAMETFLVLDGFEIDSPLEEQEEVILKLAAGELSREAFTEWLESHIIELR
jgi:death-on-curing protein